ncbi:uncharacterized protein LODBEIA_P07690 [Lodderomyces beijingensis]|uniref:Cytosolic Fe-S cluster assembly factor NAR1 n=1 Tax=Lodderomyces beijingensis TaxID=1775926 RepID=A0ABP0ZHB4_9ASCO
MSAILSADDLNDFISPGVACIKPVENVSTTADPSADEGQVEIQIDSQGNPLEISQIDGKQTALNPAQISLADCLACSGCITSAEEVLVAQHSHQELLKALESPDSRGKIFVASISQQSRASLATAYNVGVEDMDKSLVNLLVFQMGFKYVVGTSLGRKLSLLNESQNTISKKIKEQNEAGEQVKHPVLSSVCPGWVLYAEKTHPYVLPMISTVKSAQQITGCLVKTLTAQANNVATSQVYHLSIMPCFDKKLESARPELFGDSTPDVDCVLTAKELVTLIDESQGKYQLVPTKQSSHLVEPAIMHSSIDKVYQQFAPPSWPFVQYSWSNDPGSSSGGYAYTYLRLVQDTLVKRGHNRQDFAMKVIQGKNSDVYEMRLLYREEKIASSAIVNGFRNIQNLVRKLKPGNSTTGAGPATKVNPLAARRRARVAAARSESPKAADEVADPSKVDYVEIMACPQGCINGGGQISSPNTETTPEKDWVSEVLSKYNSVPMFDLTLNPQDLIKFTQWSQEFESEFSVSDERLFRTHFNEVEKPSDPTAIMVGSKW